jgi:hypothetical protein
MHTIMRLHLVILMNNTSALHKSATSIPMIARRTHMVMLTITGMHTVVRAGWSKQFLSCMGTVTVRRKLTGRWRQMLAASGRSKSRSWDWG